MHKNRKPTHNDSIERTITHIRDKEKNIFKPKNERVKNPSASKSHHPTSDAAYLAEYYKNNPFFKK